MDVDRPCVRLTLFSTIWFVLGNYWFWSFVRENSCNQVVYNVCWWTIVYTYVMARQPKGGGRGRGLHTTHVWRSLIHTTCTHARTHARTYVTSVKVRACPPSFLIKANERVNECV